MSGYQEDNEKEALVFYYYLIESFIKLLKEENPDIEISFHTSFNDFDEKYVEGKFCARANEQLYSKTPFIIQVNGDYKLPFEVYEEKGKECTSWRNNGYTGGMTENMDNDYRERLPLDFDVVRIFGDPLAKENSIESYETKRLSIYTIGGCALKKEETPKLH